MGGLGYLHVHPQQADPAGPAIIFDVEVPAGSQAYRLFLDFQHGGVRTASFIGKGIMTSHLPIVTDLVDLEIGGMPCASCAARIEKRLNRLDGVSATVN